MRGVSSILRRGLCYKFAIKKTLLIIVTLLVLLLSSCVIVYANGSGPECADPDPPPIKNRTVVTPYDIYAYNIITTESEITLYPVSTFGL